MLNFCSLFSSSSANCLLVYDENTKILIDCGSSLKRTSAALLGLDTDISDIGAILVTHEHSDHTSGLATISNKHNIPVYVNSLTLGQLPNYDKMKNVSIINYGEFDIGSLHITSFKTPHDGVSPSGYVIESGNSKITVATDLGHIDRSILPYFDGSDFVFIESNHDLDMLKNGPYHYNLKRRILSDFGHLSNKACSELVCYLASRGIKKFMLGHLSDSNNTPGIALAESTNALKFNGLTVDYLSVAPKDDTSEIITV